MTRPAIDDLLEKLDEIQNDKGAKARKRYSPLAIEVEIYCDTSKLYHQDLGVTIQYLVDIKTQYPNASLDEHWTGYEDMYMRFVYTRPETDDEFYHRLERELQFEIWQRKQRDEVRRKANIQKQIDKLKAQL